ncbi:MAG: glycosyltransferase, partial [Candidatus Nealsonbacteria bacterium]|nr:glycosyltransferase [Candidatus Nealsonbacteria bacterium]
TEKLAQEFQKRGIDVGVVCYSDVDRDDEYGFPVVRVSRKYPKGIRHLIYLFQLLKISGDADIVYAQGPTNSGLPALLVAKFLSKRMVLKIVGDVAWERYSQKTQEADDMDTFQSKEYGFFVESLRWIQRLVARNSDVIITPGVYLKGIIKGWGVKGDKIKVVYNAVEDFRQIDLLKKEAREKIGIKGNIILSIGRLTSWKGFDTLIVALSELSKIDSDFKLIIIGSGPEEERLKNMVQERNLEDNAIIQGRVSHEKIPLYFKAADVFILNSGYEGLPHVVLEAMQCDVPVIVSNKGGNPELVEDGVNGFLIEYNNKEEIKKAILKLLEDKNLQEKFINNSKEKVKKFNWERLVEETLKVIKK